MYLTLILIIFSMNPNSNYKTLHLVELSIKLEKKRTEQIRSANDMTTFFLKST